MRISPVTSQQILAQGAARGLQLRSARSRITPQMAAMAADLSTNRPNYPPGVIAGAAIAGLTPDSPELAQIDQAEMTRVADENRGGALDIFDDWIYDPFKGMIRGAMLGLNAGIEEMESATVRTPIGAMQGVADPFQQAGRSDLFYAGAAALRGERVNVGDGFFPQSDIAPDVQERLAQGDTLANAMAGSETQQELGAPITNVGTAQRERLQITSRGGTSVPISLGRAVAINVAEPGSNAFHYMSGMTDFAKQIFLDPADLMLGGTAQIRKLRKMPGALAGGQNAGFVAKTLNKLTLGGDGRKTFLNRGWDDYLQQDVTKGDASWVKWFVDQTGDEGYANVHDLLSHSQSRVADPKLVRQIIAITPDNPNAMTEMQGLLKTWGTVGGREGFRLDTKFRGGFRDLGAGSNIRGNPYGMGIRNNLKGTYLGRLANSTNAKAVNVMDPRQAVEAIDDYMINMGDALPEASRNKYLARVISQRQDPNDLAAFGESAVEKGAHAFYFGVIKDITNEYIANVKKTMRETSATAEITGKGKRKGKPISLSEEILDSVGRLFDDMDDYRAYFLNGAGDDMVFGGARFTMMENGVAKAQPSAISISQFMEQSIPLIDSKKMRAINRRSNGFLANKKITQQVYRNMFGKNDYNKLGKNVAMTTADVYMTKLWKPAVLLRVSWPMRVIGEEQLRLSGAQLSGVFNHPMQFISLAFMHRIPALQKYARMSDDIQGVSLTDADALDQALSSGTRSYTSAVYGEGPTRWIGKAKEDMSVYEVADSQVIAFNQVMSDPVASAVGSTVRDHMRAKYRTERGMTQADWDKLTPEEIDGLPLAWDTLTEEDWSLITLDEVKERFWNGDLEPVREMLLLDAGRWEGLASRVESDNYVDTIHAWMTQNAGGKGDLLHGDTKSWYDLDGIGTDPPRPGVRAKGDIPGDPRDPLTRSERLASGQLETRPQYAPSVGPGQGSPRQVSDEFGNNAQLIYDDYRWGRIEDGQPTTEADVRDALLEQVAMFNDASGGTVPRHSLEYISGQITSQIQTPSASSMNVAITEAELDTVFRQVDEWMAAEVQKMDPNVVDNVASTLPEGATPRPPRDYTQGELRGREEYIPHREAGEEGWSGLETKPYEATFGDMQQKSLVEGAEFDIMRADYPNARTWDDLSVREQREVHNKAIVRQLRTYRQPPTGEAAAVTRVLEEIQPDGSVLKVYLRVQPDGQVTGNLSIQIAGPGGAMGFEEGTMMGVPLAMGIRTSMGPLIRDLQKASEYDIGAMMRMTSGGETMTDYLRRMGMDLPDDITPQELINHINSDPDAWNDLSIWAQEGRGPGVGGTSRTDAGARLQQSAVKRARPELEAAGQHRPAFNQRDMGDARIWELYATGKIGDDFAWGTTRRKSGGQKSGSKIQDLHAKRKEFFASDESFYDAAPQYLRVNDTDPASVSRVSGWDKAVNNMFSFLMAKPTDALSRSPAFKQFYWRRVAHMYQDMTEDMQREILTSAKRKGVNVHYDETNKSFWNDLAKPLREIRMASGRGSAVDEVITTFNKGAKGKLGSGALDNMADIDEMAKVYALEETKRLLYDLANRHNWSDQLRIILPFGEAWFEVATTWGRLMKENPRVLRRAQQAIEGGRESNPMPGVDPDGEQGRGLFYKDPVTGEEMFGIPGGDLIQSWMPGMNTGEAGRDINFAGRLSGLNMMANVLPGIGPIVQIPLSGMGWASDPDQKWAQELLLPFGKSTFKVTNPTTWMGPLTPAWFQKGMVGFFGGGDEDNQRVYHNTVIDVYKSLLMQGWSAETPEEMQKTLAEAGKLAKNVYRIRALSSFLAPTSASPTFEVEFDAEGDANGEVWAYQNLATAYREILDEEDGDEVAAFKGFVDRFGLDPMLFAVGKTQRTMARAVTIEARKWEHDNMDLYEPDMFPTTGYYAHPDPTDGEFDYEAYLMNLDDETRTPLTPLQWAEKRNQFLGRVSYNNFQREASRRFGTSPVGTNWLRSQYSALMVKYPGYGRPVIGLPAKPSLDMQIAELYRWDEDERLYGSTVGQSLARYLAQRDMTIRRTQTSLGYQTDTGFRQGQQAAMYRRQLRTFGERLVNENPEFLPVWEQVLGRELDEPETTMAPINLAGVEF